METTTQLITYRRIHGSLVQFVAYNGPWSSGPLHNLIQTTLEPASSFEFLENTSLGSYRTRLVSPSLLVVLIFQVCACFII